MFVERFSLYTRVVRTRSAALLVVSLVACNGGSTTLSPMPKATTTSGASITVLAATAGGVRGSIPTQSSRSAIDLVSQSFATPSAQQVQVALTTQGTALATAARAPAAQVLPGAARAVRTSRYGPGDIRQATPLHRTGGIVRSRLVVGRTAATIVGTQQAFTVPLTPLDQPNGGTYQPLNFTLEGVTPNFSLWIESSVAPDYAARASQIGADFENALASDVRWIGLPATYTTSATGLSAAVDTCDAAGNVTGSGPAFIAPYTTINVLVIDPTKLNVRLGGQFAPDDLDTQAAANCKHLPSNQAATITIGIDPSITNLDYRFTEFMAHEATHLIQYVNGAIALGRQGDTPVLTREGIAELSIDFAFGHPDYNNISQEAGTFFLPAPQNYSILSMTGIENGAFSSAANLGNYGAAYLFMRYIADRYGPGFARTFFLNDRYAGEAQSFADLASAAGATSFAQLFSDFGTTLAAASNPVAYGPPYAITSFSLSGTYTSPSETSSSATFTLPGVASAGSLPAAPNVPLFPGGIAILDSSQRISGANFSANDPSGALQLGGSIVSY